MKLIIVASKNKTKFGNFLNYTNNLISLDCKPLTKKKLQLKLKSRSRYSFIQIKYLIYFIELRFLI